MALQGCLRHVYKLPNFSEELQETLIFRTDRFGLFSGYFLSVLGHVQNEPNKLCLHINFASWHYFWRIYIHALLSFRSEEQTLKLKFFLDPCPRLTISAFQISLEKGNQFHLCPRTKVLWSVSLSLHIIIAFTHSYSSPILLLVAKAGF